MRTAALEPYDVLRRPFAKAETSVLDMKTRGMGTVVLLLDSDDQHMAQALALSLTVAVAASNSSLILVVAEATHKANPVMVATAMGRARAVVNSHHIMSNKAMDIRNPHTMNSMGTAIKNPHIANSRSTVIKSLHIASSKNMATRTPRTASDRLMASRNRRMLRKSTMITAAGSRTRAMREVAAMEAATTSQNNTEVGATQPVGAKNVVKNVLTSQEAMGSLRLVGWTPTRAHNLAGVSMASAVRNNTAEDMEGMTVVGERNIIRSTARSITKREALMNMVANVPKILDIRRAMVANLVEGMTVVGERNIIRSTARSITKRKALMNMVANVPKLLDIRRAMVANLVVVIAATKSNRIFTAEVAVTVMVVVAVGMKREAMIVDGTITRRHLARNDSTSTTKRATRAAVTISMTPSTDSFSFAQTSSFPKCNIQKSPCTST